MKKQYCLLLIISGLITLPSFAQDAAPKPETETVTNKGKIYVFWGWNRSWYTNSDIHFSGNNYNFTLDDVHAQDRQSKIGLTPYFKPSLITIPQTNLRIGYFINDKIDLSFGVDHMKYIMPNDQTVSITGNIHDDSNYDNTYTNDEIKLTKDFLFFEHSDGLNYLNTEITRNDDLLKFMKINMNPEKIQVNTLIGFGVGVLMPKTNATLWDNERNDDFHIAGYGFDAKVGLNVTFFKYFFLRTEYKGGFIDMSDIRTSPDPSDKASQHFFYTEFVAAFGFVVNPFN